MTYATWASPTPSIEATDLVMELRGVASGVRSAQFHDPWSRLYKAKEYTLDLSCKPEARQSRLMGQVILSSGRDLGEHARVSLYQGRQLIAETELDSYGYFDFAIEKQGNYELKVALEAKTLSVSSLRVN